MLHGSEYLLSAEKRKLDVIAGTMIGLALMPLGSTVAAGTAIDASRYNPLYVQKRSGGVRPAIDAYKFRTLSRDIGSISVDQTFGTFDPRATRFGQFIRQSGLDEIPQIVNILKGDMTLVGIRPLVAADIERYASIAPELFDEWLPIYTSSKPGLTGKSQIYRRHYGATSDELIFQSMKMDLQYATEASLGTDIKLLAQTPFQLTMSNIAVIENAALPEQQLVRST